MIINRNLRILHVNTRDAGGGADHVVWALHREFLSQGHSSWMYVGAKKRNDPLIIAGNNDAYRSLWVRTWLSLGNYLNPLETKIRGIWRLREFLTHGLGQTKRWMEILKGHEDFDFPATHRILDLVPEKLDIIHCHNLHGGYFDLRALPRLSREAPLCLTLHDAWLLTGHCAHSFDCERWKIGCGECPDLRIYPPIRRDGTAHNWRRKRGLFDNTRLYAASPCRWLMQKVEQSILADAVLDARVIPHGIDLGVFKLADKQGLRRLLDLPVDSKIVLLAANSLHTSVWKDPETLRRGIAQTADSLPNAKLLFVALGKKADDEWIGPARIRYIPFQDDPAAVARYCQTSDLYVHPAGADTFPNAVLEALACGTPVVATAVGGIPEQVDDGATGFLVPPHDPGAMGKAIMTMLTDDAFRRGCGRRAAEDARKRFDVRRMVDDYLHWYREILKRSRQQREETHAIA
ncbi:MAG: glycosyltransferase [bacterium]